MVEDPDKADEPKDSVEAAPAPSGPDPAKSEMRWNFSDGLLRHGEASEPSRPQPDPRPSGPDPGKPETKGKPKPGSKTVGR